MPALQGRLGLLKPLLPHQTRGAAAESSDPAGSAAAAAHRQRAAVTSTAGGLRRGPGATEGGGTEKLRTEGVGGSFPLHRNICLVQALPPFGETLLSKRELRRKAPDGRYPGSPTVATVPGLLRRFGFVQRTAELRVKTRNYPNWARGLF